MRWRKLRQTKKGVKPSPQAKGKYLATSTGVDKWLKFSTHYEEFIDEYIITKHSEGSVVKAVDSAIELDKSKLKWKITKQGVHKAKMRLEYARKQASENRVAHTPERDIHVLQFVVGHILPSKEHSQTPGWRMQAAFVAFFFLKSDLEVHFSRLTP